MEEDDICSFEELIENLEDIKYGLSNTLDVGEAIYCLAKEIEKIKQLLSYTNYCLAKEIEKIKQQKK